MKKYLVITIILLILMMNVAGAMIKDTFDNSNMMFDKTILYVGGSGPNNYSSIKEAVGIADNGDTVFVYNGLYYEYEIHIYKSINIIGEDKVAELMENIEMPDYSDELDTIIMGNDELRDRIYTLNKMNTKSETPDWYFPIICEILQSLINSVANLFRLLIDSNIPDIIYWIPYSIIWGFVHILDLLFCRGDYPPY